MSKSRSLAQIIGGPLLALLAAGCGGDRVELVGTVERNTLELSAPLAEVVVELPLERGQRVEAGQIVVQLDPAVASAELVASQAAQAAAEASEQQAQREFERIQGLRKAAVSSQQELDHAKRNIDEAVAVTAERAARVAQATKHLADLTLRSHNGGVVDQLPYEVGERVPAGGIAAVVVTDDPPWIRVWLPARAVARASRDTVAEVAIEGLPKRLHGRLLDVAREPEFTPHYALTEAESAHLVFEARIVLEDAPADLRPGLPARVSLPLGDGG